MKIMLLAVIIISFVIVTPAQEEDTSYKYWITVGGWIGDNVSFNINYSFSLSDNFVKVGYFTRGGFSLGRIMPVGKDGFLYKAIDISIGKRFLTEWFMACVFLGPSYVFGKERTHYGPYKNFGTFGLESDIQLLFRPGDDIGFGVGLYSNLNFANNYTGININITLGNGK